MLAVEVGQEVALPAGEEPLRHVQHHGKAHPPGVLLAEADVGELGQAEAGQHGLDRRKVRHQAGIRGGEVVPDGATPVMPGDAGLAEPELIDERGDIGRDGPLVVTTLGPVGITTPAHIHGHGGVMSR